MTTTSETWAPPTEFAEDLRERYGLECPPRWGTPRHPDRPSLGPKLWKVMAKLGAPPMPWQKYVTDVALELDPATGRFAHREVGLSVSRQQGKTELCLGAQVHRALAWPRQNIVYAAQTRNDARKRWEDEFWEKISGSDLAKYARIRKSNGNEAILFPGKRSRMGITANTEKAGHGPPLDMGFIDEAFAHIDDRLEQAFSPAMLTRAMAQLWWASAGGTTKSVWLNKKRENGRALIEALWDALAEDPAAARPRTAYFEWYAPEDMDRSDPATWRATLPALGYTVTEEIIAAELEKMDPAEFDRAYLNRTRKPTPPTDPNVPKLAWPGLVDAGSKPVADSVALAIDVSKDRAHASIAAASLRPDGKVHVEVVARRPGTDWVVPAVAKLHQLWKPVAVAVASSGAPAGSLIDDLVAAGIEVPKDKAAPERGDLAVMRAGDITEACGQLADAMNQSTVVHLDQVPLTAAVNGARTRRNGDAWQLDRTASLVDISPLCAVTFARWALLVRGPLVEEGYDPMSNIF
ncbi:terminase large subunit domain-containing protein [Streptomyces olivaceus]|uniref:terminase large subunit domain-containing protein n=1 Tax=Streptomyces olivaceus TaxID=47716 RepID=UPI001CCF2316|nr:terminase family protein [Streptomyces olivaceus]MBZ6135762.1 terminase [Streptomyces olivaceus]